MNKCNNHLNIYPCYRHNHSMDYCYRFILNHSMKTDKHNYRTDSYHSFRKHIHLLLKDIYSNITFNFINTIKILKFAQKMKKN